MKRLALALALVMPLPVVAQDAPVQTPSLFDEVSDGAAALTVALTDAQMRQAADPAGPPQRVLAIFGANWCHDSRDLAAMLQQPRIAALIARQYQLVLIDAGMPQTGRGRNLDVAARHGVSDINGTPTVLVLDAEGALLNTPDNARGWRNASSRSEREVYRFLRQYAKPQD